MSVGYDYDDPWPPVARLAQFTATRYADTPRAPSNDPRLGRNRVWQAASKTPGEFLTGAITSLTGLSDSTVVAALQAGVAAGRITFRAEHVRGRTSRYFWRWLGAPIPTEV